MRLLPAARPALLAVVTAAAVAVTALPAHAASRTITDEAGDATGGDVLDITGATLVNGDSRVRITTQLAELGRGDLIVFLQPRGRRGVARVVSEYRPARDTVRTSVLGPRSERPVRCNGVTSTWADGQVDITVPSRCLFGGDYGALRTAILTEKPGGSDVDNAPGSDEDFGYSRYVARG